jgi:predicted RNA methylase
MMIGMTTKAKIAVTIDPARLEAARRAVSEGLVGSVSAYVERAMERYEQVDPFVADLDETLMKTGGPITEEERAQFDRELGL